MGVKGEFQAGIKAKGVLCNSKAPWDETTVDTADGAKIHVRSFGPADAQPIVLIHGFACRLEYWNPQINRFRDRYRVIAYDQRGLGRSTLGRAGVNPKVLGDDLAAVLDATVSPARPALLVGHSFGGITIMAWAQGHSEQVRTLATAALLANTVAARFRATTGVMPFAGRYGALRAPLLSLVMRAPLSVPSSAPISRAVRAIAMSPQATLAQADFLRAMVTSVPTGIRNQWGEGLFKLDVLKGLEQLHIPCTVLVGDMDRLTPPEAGRAIEAVLRRRGVLHRYVELEKVGHCSNLQAAEAFDDEIIELLEVSRESSNSED